MMTLPLPNHRHATATMIHHQRAHSVRALNEERASVANVKRQTAKKAYLIDLLL